MLKRFQCGSIRWQITALAIGPVILAALLAAVMQPLNLIDFHSVSEAKRDAIKIEMVVDQIRAAATPEQRTAILDAVNRSGLAVEPVSVLELSGEGHDLPFDANLAKFVRYGLRPELSSSLRTQTTNGALHNVLVVGVDAERALAFAPAVTSPDTWFGDRQINLLLKIIVVLLPVLSLSFYAGCVISGPLKRFADAAKTLKPDEGPDTVFEENGPSEIRTLAKSLNDMRCRVRGMINDRTRMLRAISHDLRTPLTRLRLRAERSTQPALREAMLADIAGLDEMIEETLTYLSKDMSTEKVLRADLPSLLGTVCNDFADIGFAVSYEGPERFAYGCKPRSLARAVSNLVDNGTKFADAVVVSLEVAADGAVRIAVSDNGPGLPAELRAKVLEPFFKVDTARTVHDRGGFGLGLSIVDDIARSHGGAVSLADGTPHGLVVSIDLPADMKMADISAIDKTTVAGNRTGSGPARLAVSR